VQDAPPLFEVLIMITDEDVEKALDNEYDGVDTFDLVEELLTVKSSRDKLVQLGRDMLHLVEIDETLPIVEKFKQALNEAEKL